jgi:hypothetical protein
MHVDTIYIYIYLDMPSKIYIFRFAKRTYNLEQMEYQLRDSGS